MEDSRLIEMYFERSEAAVASTAEKYGKYCTTVCLNVLGNREDADECVNDTYMKVWNSIPPTKPSNFKAFIGKIARNLAINRYEYLSAEKRGGGQVHEVLDELDFAIPARSDVEGEIEKRETAGLINKFLGGLAPEKRKLFVRRYWYLSPVKEIADMYGMSESNVKTSLKRIRDDLREYLLKEGVTV